MTGSNVRTIPDSSEPAKEPVQRQSSECHCVRSVIPVSSVLITCTTRSSLSPALNDERSGSPTMVKSNPSRVCRLSSTTGKTRSRSCTSKYKWRIRAQGSNPFNPQLLKLHASALSPSVFFRTRPKLCRALGSKEGSAKPHLWRLTSTVLCTSVPNLRQTTPLNCKTPVLAGSTLNRPYTSVPPRCDWNTCLSSEF